MTMRNLLRNQTPVVAFTVVVIEIGSEVGGMSVSLGIHKGPVFNCYNSEFIDDVPVSFQDIWNNVWEPAIAACDVHVFRSCLDFTVSQIPQVLEELDRIYDWVQINVDKDTEYISWRIHDELKPFLMRCIIIVKEIGIQRRQSCKRQ